MQAWPTSHARAVTCGSTRVLVGQPKWLSRPCRQRPPTRLSAALPAAFLQPSQLLQCLPLPSCVLAPGSSLCPCRGPQAQDAPSSPGAVALTRMWTRLTPASQFSTQSPFPAPCLLLMTVAPAPPLQSGGNLLSPGTHRTLSLLGSVPSTPERPPSLQHRPLGRSSKEPGPASVPVAWDPCRAIPSGSIRSLVPVGMVPTPTLSIGGIITHPHAARQLAWGTLMGVASGCQRALWCPAAALGRPSARSSPTQLPTAPLTVAPVPKPGLAATH